MDKEDDKRRVLFILGGDHPSAHLRGNPEQVERFDRLSLLEAAAMDLSMEVAKMTTEDFDSRKDCLLKDMFSKCLEKRDEEYVKTRKARLTGLKTTLGSAGILKDCVAANYVEGSDDVYLKDTHKCLRHAQFEDEEVCTIVKTFVNTFGEKVAVKCFKSGTLFICVEIWRFWNALKSTRCFQGRQRFAGESVRRLFICRSC